MDKYSVIPLNLNLRKTPDSTGMENIIRQLPRGTIVELIEKIPDSKWWRVRIEDEDALEGCVSSNYLQKIEKQKIREVHLPPLNTPVTPDSLKWWYPLSDPEMPFRNETDSLEERIMSIYHIIKYLRVDESARHKKRKNKEGVTLTYCNVYAYDYCYLNRVYLPRVWWCKTALDKIKKGEYVEIVRGKTVGEQNANALFSWLVNQSEMFGWRRVSTLKELQFLANQGKIGIICGKNRRKNKNGKTMSGHISCVIPEPPKDLGLPSITKGEIPLQSQAGGINFKYRYAYDWWDSYLKGTNIRRFRKEDVGYWIHD